MQFHEKKFDLFDFTSFFAWPTVLYDIVVVIVTAFVDSNSIQGKGQFICPALEFDLKQSKSLLE